MLQQVIQYLKWPFMYNAQTCKGCKESSLTELGVLKHIKRIEKTLW